MTASDAAVGARRAAVSASAPARGAADEAAAAAAPKGVPVDVRVLVLQAVFLGTGVASTLAMQQIAYEGAGSGAAQLSTLLTYLGMALSGGLGASPADAASGGGPLFSRENPLAVRLAGVTSLGLAANALVVPAIAVAGSGLFQVTYSSITVFIAIFSRVFLARRLTAGQWTAIVVVTAGLVISGLDSAAAPPPPPAKGVVLAPGGGRQDAAAPAAAEPPAASLAMAGFLLSLFTTALFATQYVVFELVLGGGRRRGDEKGEVIEEMRYPGGGDSDSESGQSSSSEGDQLLRDAPAAAAAAALARPTPRRVCFMTGVYGSIAMLAYVAFFTVPQWDEVMSVPVHEAGGSMVSAMALYGVFFLSNLVHNAVYFGLVNKTGALSTGILQALRGIFVFGFSAALFCNGDADRAAQCLTPNKMASCVVVIGGVLLYVGATARASGDCGGGGGGDRRRGSE